MINSKNFVNVTMYPQYNNNKKNLDLFTILRSYDLKMQNKKIENFKKKLPILQSNVLCYMHIHSWQNINEITKAQFQDTPHISIDLFLYIYI
jgi:D-lyxose ketol-isomerase